MRTTLNIPLELLKEAQDLLGFTSKTDTVIISLKELIRQKRIEELKSLSGKINLKIDIKKERKRSK
ncbi:MAG: type II toxin-antitoxin system VapB family antitoxin [Bacteriovoracaceae bacterium]|nr:type II toxin-antitoxin system VapB family antitoxin [Bacteriovoracaceae bacterium]